MASNPPSKLKLVHLQPPYAYTAATYWRGLKEQPTICLGIERRHRIGSQLYLSLSNFGLGLGLGLGATALAHNSTFLCLTDLCLQPLSPNLSLAVPKQDYAKKFEMKVFQQTVRLVQQRFGPGE